ncbi:MAG: hypothetical protein ACYCYI_05145 [Saccharofermentanales bacterium]
MPSLYMILEQIALSPIFVIIAAYIVPADDSVLFLISLPAIAIFSMLYDYFPKLVVLIPCIVISFVASLYFLPAIEIGRTLPLILIWLFKGGLILFTVYIYTIFRSLSFHQARNETANLPPLLMIIVNLLIGLACKLTNSFSDIRIYLYVSVILSMVAAVIILILSQIDRSLWYGSNVMKMPRIQKRNNFILGTIIIAILLLFSGAYSSLFENIKLIAMKVNHDNPIVDVIIPAGIWPSKIGQAQGPSTIMFIIRDIIAILSIIAVSFLLIRLIIILIYRFLIFIRTLFVDVKVRIYVNEIGFTDTVDNTLFSSILKRRRNNKEKRKWDKLNDDFARIRFIFKEYIIQAENAGIHTTESQTPRETCDFIREQAGSNFPLPGKLAEYYDSARYGNIKPYHDEIMKLKNDLLAL